MPFFILNRELCCVAWYFGRRESLYIHTYTDAYKGCVLRSDWSFSERQVAAAPRQMRLLARCQIAEYVEVHTQKYVHTARSQETSIRFSQRRRQGWVGPFKTKKKEPVATLL